VTPRELVEVVFRPSPAARLLVHSVLLVVAVVVTVRAVAVLQAGAAALVGFLAVGTALAIPFLLDLWAVVAADNEGISWRNRLWRHRLAWAAVAGFERGPTSMALRRADGRVVPLRALGLRYFGSKRLATERIRILERLRTSAFRVDARG
jgi:hypothetical protein